MAATLSPLDASFLYYEQPNQPMHVGGLMVLESSVDFAALQAMLGERLGTLARYRQHPVRTVLDLAAPHWEWDHPFDPAFHIRRTRVAPPGDAAAFHATVDALFATACDLTRSPWEAHLIEGLTDGRAAILSKVHHCMIDGVSGAQILELMTDPDGSMSGLAPAPPPLPAAAPIASERFDPLQALGRVREAFDAIGAVSALTTTPMGPLPFNGRLSPNRCVRWASFALDDVLALRGAAGCKVNDVVLAIITGALRRYLDAVGSDVDHQRVRTLVPVSMRTANERLALGNRVSAMFATLPIDVREPRARLHAVMRETQALKTHGQPQALGLAMALASALPSAAGPVFASVAARYPIVHTVCTNIPGPRGMRTLLGARVLDVHPIVPIGLDMGLGFAILSYAGRLSISATMDPGLVPDPALMPRALEESANELCAALGTSARVSVPSAVTAHVPVPTVADLMTREVVTVRPEATLADAWTTMHEARIRHLVVGDAKGRLIGVVTHRDLLSAAQSRMTFPNEADRMRMLSWVHVADAMETHVSTASPAEPAAVAGRRMANHKLGCLPVVDGDRLVGVVTEHDFLRWATAHMERATA
jgi:WS/DGAT/MGAT family acyltransferase